MLTGSGPAYLPTINCRNGICFSTRSNRRCGPVKAGTGVQTCALPIYGKRPGRPKPMFSHRSPRATPSKFPPCCTKSTSPFAYNMPNNSRLFSRMSLPVAVLAVLLAFVPGPAAGKERITILYPGAHQPVIDYGVRELSSLLKDKFDVRLAGAPDEKGWNIVLKVDTAMRPFSFSVRQPKSAGYTTVYLSGHDETCVLHAVYTLLQLMGYTFDLTGVRKPRVPSLQRLAGYNRVIQPAVEWRGIRQHINFLMDISSYPAREAKEYIRNLARMRMNCITFHSYPGQWYAYTYQGARQLAGNFFYGEVDSVPADRSIRKLVRNKSVYCIPEIEPFWDDHEKRSQMAIAWLNDVMAEAKKVGMKVRFSYELRTPGIDYARATCLAVVQEYPRIDELEFITEEDVPG